MAKKAVRWVGEVKVAEDKTRGWRAGEKRRFYVYAKTKQEAAFVFLRNRMRARFLTVDGEPWKTSCVENWTGSRP